MRDDSEDGLGPVAWPAACPANRKLMRRRVWRAVRGVLWCAAKKLIGLAWMAAKVWAAFGVARLTVPEFFYPGKKSIEVGVDAAVMMVGVLLAVCFLTRDN